MTGTPAPNPPSSRAQACQPAAENLPVCLELQGTQASPRVDERQRKVEDRRVGYQLGGEQCWNRGKQKEMSRDKTHMKRERQSENEVLAAQLQTGYSLRVYEASAQVGEKGELHWLCARSQPSGFTLQIKP